MNVNPVIPSVVIAYLFKDKINIQLQEKKKSFTQLIFLYRFGEEYKLLAQLHSKILC